MKKRQVILIEYDEMEGGEPYSDFLCCEHIARILYFHSLEVSRSISNLDVTTISEDDIENDDDAKQFNTIVSAIENSVED